MTPEETIQRIKSEALEYANQTVHPKTEGSKQLHTYSRQDYIAGSTVNWNKAIDAAITSLKETGWTIDDYNGRIIFNTLEALKIPE